MSQCCRVCLKEKEEVPFVNLINKIFQEKTVLQIIADCAPIEVLNDDPLPQVVCINCLEKLKSFYELRQLILNSDIALKKIYSHIKVSPLKYEILREKEYEIENKTNIHNIKELEGYCEQDNPKYKTEENLMVQNGDIPKSEFDHDTEILIVKDNKDDFKTSLKYIDNGSELYGKQKGNKEKKHLKKPLRKLKRMHECKECNKIFKKADHYTLHMTKHTGEKKYACEFCPKRFARSYVLVYHRRVHTGERPYTCDICSKSFSSPSNFYTHKKIHTGQRNYKCEICDESFIQSDSLKIHIRRIHTGERPFLCEICSSAFRSNSSLLTHKLDMHGKKEACPFCDKLYSSRVLKEHIRRHKEREQGIKRFVCDQCGKRFTCSSSRKKHLLIHSGEKPFSCEICEKSFNQRSALKTHMRIHSDFMPFPCDYCSKSFRYKHHLRSHVNIHHKEEVEDILSNSCQGH